MPSRHQGRSSIVIATRRALVASASVFGLLAAAAQAQTPAPDAPIGRAAGTEATGISDRESANAEHIKLTLARLKTKAEST